MTMIKKTLCVAALSMGVSVGYLAWATAPGDGEPPPPPSLNDCSPGFWKNHSEYIAPYCGGVETCVNNIVAQLSAQGPGSGDTRQGWANTLNSWADGYYKAQICAD